MFKLEAVISGSRKRDGAALEENVRRAASGLAGLGVRSGDPVAILMRNDFPQIEATAAAQLLGAYPVQINWHGHPEEIAYVISDSGARTLVAHADMLASLPQDALRSIDVIAAAVPDDLASVYRVSEAVRAVPPGVPEWQAWLAAHPATEREPALSGESIIYTSGTSGRPKGVRRFVPTPELAARSERMRRTVFGIAPGARVIVPAPLYHTAPNLFAMRALRLADLLMLPPRFEPREFLRSIETHRITHAYLVAPLFGRLLEIPEQKRRGYDLSSLRFILHAGGPSPRGIKQAMIDWLGPIIHEYYGSTEAGPNTFCTAAEWMTRPGTAGRAIEGVDIEVRGEDGALLPDGEIGEFWVRNDNFPDFTYINRPADRADLQRGDHIATGDLGYRDADGYLFLCDRKRDLVISGGVNIYPAEIEGALQEMPGVADCVVFGIPDEEFGESLAALIQPGADGPAITADAVRAHLAARLARFKMPKLIEFRDALPRDDSGKIRKRLLRDPYWQAAGRSI